MSLGDRDTALQRFEDLLARHPEATEGRAEYAGVLVQASRLGEATEQYRILLEANPESLETHRALANVLIQTKQYANAEVHLITILDRQPDEVETALLLARVHAWQKEYDAATQVYRRYLRDLNSVDDDILRIVAPLLLDTQHPEEALSILKDLRQRMPEDLAIASDLARCHTQLADHRSANSVVDGMTTIQPKDTATRLGLAEYLANAGNYRASIRLYDQILRFEPENESARLGQAELYLAAMMPARAEEVLSGPGLRMDSVAFRRTKAEYHAAVGEFGEAQAILQDLLVRDSADDEARMALGDLYFISQEYEKSRSELEKISTSSHLDRDARLKISRCLAAERRFAESDARCRELIGEDPGDVRPLTQLIRNLGQTGEVERAEWLAQDYLRRSAADGYGALEIRLALASALLIDNQALRARELYAQVLAHPAGRVPEAHYGLAASEFKLDNESAAQDALMSATLSILGDDIRTGIMIGDHAFADGLHDMAIGMYDKILRWDPDNLQALVRLAEAQSAGWDSESLEVAADTFEQVLQRSPSNIRARMGLARAYASRRDIVNALDQYDIVLRHDARNTKALREKARVQFWAQDLDESASTYEGILKTASFENIETNLHEDVNFIDLDHVQAERRAVAEVRAVAEMEHEAKSLRQSLKLFDAIPAYRNLIRREPLNQEARFELAQCYAETGQTSRAIAEYAELLKVNPNHREANIAIDRSEYQLSARAFGGIDMTQMAGREGEGRLDRTDTTIGGRMPFGDEDAFAEVKYVTSNLVSEDFSSNGNILMARAQFSPLDQSGAWEKLLFGAAVGFEDYVENLDAELIYDLDFDVRFNDLFRIYGNAFQQNIIENHNSIKPFGDPSMAGLAFDNGPVSRTGTNFGIGIQPQRMWDLGANVTTASYSDDNSLFGFHLYNGVNLSLPPKELRVAMNVDYQDFAVPVSDTYKEDIGAARYFAPNQYTTFSGSVEWRHWLSRDHFKGSNETWYTASYAGIWDSDGDFYNQLRAGLHYDYSQRMAIEIETGMLASAFYDTAVATINLVFAF